MEQIIVHGNFDLSFRAVVGYFHKFCLLSRIGIISKYLKPWLVKKRKKIRSFHFFHQLGTLITMYHRKRKSFANGKSLKDVVTHIHRKTTSLAFIVTLRVAWPNRVGIYNKVQKDEREECYKKVENR